MVVFSNDVCSTFTTMISQISLRATYEPDTSVRLFSVKEAALNVYSTILKDTEIVIFKGDGTIATLGKFNNDL
jgi:hypothetical protein